MRVGVGLPTTLPGADGKLVIEWARLADDGPFTSVGVLDRLTYDSYDPFTSLAAAAAATRRVLLATTIAVGPLYNTPMLAKMAASIDALSGGRFVLGLAVGARHEDYVAAGVDYRTRGRRLAEQLAALRALWEEAQGPRSARAGGPAVLVGGTTDVVYSRVARYADGYVHGGGPPRAFARAADKARAAWSDAGRPGKPQLWGQSYFALGGDEFRAVGMDYLRDYYAFTGPFAEKIASGILTTPQAIAGFLRGYEEAGCDELVLFPTVPDISQLEQLATVLAQLQVPV
ncbi:MAG: LLM class flavin-dependent oxidoreductase [Chloroflexota bacterium]|nr:LLM class flavin-dependent oxidoreductase [Chloroflexota bacterium]